MNAEHVLVQTLNGNDPNQGQERTSGGDTAALHGHDADIPPFETPSVASTDLFTGLTQESHPRFPPPSSAGLAPSTISQWIPNKVSAASEDQLATAGKAPLGGERSISYERALAPGLEEKNTQIASSLTAGTSSLAPGADLLTDSENVPETASVATKSPKPEATPTSATETAPYSAKEATSDSSPSPKAVFDSAPKAAASSNHEAAAGGNGSPASSNLEKEIDLEGSHPIKDIDLEASHPHENQDKNEPEATKAEVDPNIVDWDGPDDPKNPINWPEKLKWANVAVIAAITFLTPLASSMLAPAVPEVMTEFKSTNEELASFVVSVYILGYAFGPLVIAPFSELYGRVLIYHVCNVMFIVFTIACAVSTNLNMLIGWRFLQGTFGSCPLTIGGGTISDMIIQQKRGGVMAIWALGPLMGPVIGPVAGGYLAQAEGWRWVFWVIAIAAGVITISAFFSLRESYPPVLLERKAKRLRKETGNLSLTSKMKSPLSPAALFRISIVRPMKLLLFSPIVLALSTYMAVVYGYLYLLFTTITLVYEDQYHFSQGTVGLTYLGIGIGSLFGVVIFGIASDRILKAKSKAGEMKAEYRLPPMIPGSFFIPIGLFLYGWSADKHVFWIVPILGTGLVGLGLLATFMPIQTYLVDAFTVYAASALAANTVLRSLVGAVLPLAGQKMYATLGLGWGNSLLAFIAVAMCPIPVIFYKYGERIRKSPRFQLKL